MFIQVPEFAEELANAVNPPPGGLNDPVCRPGCHATRADRFQEQTLKVPTVGRSFRVDPTNGTGQGRARLGQRATGGGHTWRIAPCALRAPSPRGLGCQTKRLQPFGIVVMSEFDVFEKRAVAAKAAGATERLGAGFD